MFETSVTLRATQKLRFSETFSLTVSASFGAESGPLVNCMHFAIRVGSNATDTQTAKQLLVGPYRSEVLLLNGAAI